MSDTTRVCDRCNGEYEHGDRTGMMSLTDGGVELEKHLCGPCYTEMVYHYREVGDE